MICFAGRCLAVLATPPHNFGAEGGTRTRALDVGNVASWPLDDFRLERAARVELASSGWRPEAPAAIPCSLLAGDEGLEPSYLDLETSVLAAGRISRNLAELTGIEPVPADRRSAILPIDHSSGSLPWTRTTISAFRAQRPAIGRRGNFKIVKELVAGERFERPYPDSKSRVLPLDDPASRFQRYRFHAPHSQHGRFIDVVS